jgi:SAM-dependent methyltransferase
MSEESRIVERENRLRDWFTQGCDPIQAVVDGLDIGWGGVRRWATARIPAPEGLHLDIACGYATFLAQLGWRFPHARLVGLNIDFEGPHALARSLLAGAGVPAALVQADARRMPFADSAFGSASCFLGLQDIEIGFGEEGAQEAMAEAVRVLRAGGMLALLDEIPTEQLEALLDGLPVTATDQAERTVDVRWSRQVAERAIALYAEGWAAQARVEDGSAREQAQSNAHRRMAVEMERQLAAQGTYVPFGPVRMVIGRRLSDEASRDGS